jgi:hypothetical protein
MAWADSQPCAREVAFTLGNSFTGSTYSVDSSALPPDCNGMAGPRSFVELINGRFSAYSKTNGVRVFTSSAATFWVNAGISLEGALTSDPRLVYDPSISRWFAVAIDLNRGREWSNRFLVAISASADPTKTWKGFAFLADPNQGNFADFPTLGLDKHGVYLAARHVRCRMELTWAEIRSSPFPKRTCSRKAPPWPGVNPSGSCRAIPLGIFSNQ